MDRELGTPALNDLVHPLRIGSVATRELDTLYYDTADYRLVRSGAELRLGLGGPVAGWHLKLPGPDPDSRIELRRQAPEVTESTFLARPPAVPDDLRDLTTARAGGLALQPVARLRTHRRTTVLVDPASRPVAEVDEDEVRAYFDHHHEPETTWHEVEIELLDGRPRDLDRLTRRLERHGGHRAPYRSKISRAIGPPAASPLVPEARLPTGIDDPVATVFEARWQAQVVELIDRDSRVRMGDDEAVHKMRVAARRLRSALRTFRPLLDRAQARRMADELRWLGAVLGSLRDAHVLGDEIGRMVEDLPATEVLGPVAIEIGRHFAGTRAEAGADVLAALRSERYLVLLEGGGRLLRRRPDRLSRRPADRGHGRSPAGPGTAPGGPAGRSGVAPGAGARPGAGLA